ncbi:tRNA-specific adenosine deaminase 2 [Diabrotica undecimpunctata]|uniref:tRNA-specific adenosine deaminase 2 n=1 Tax=Diabrotica undecimpunctata TaxID=50387 RepID=UPI003B63629C
MSQNVEFSEKECLFMDKAFFFAKEALSVQEVPVGCVFVYHDNIIALGRNTVNETRNATRHAEINCIEDIVEYSKKNNLDYNQVFQETSVYVTVEPCIMCAAALYDLKIKRIIYGCKNDRFGGQTVFDVAGVMTPVTEVKGGYRSEEAMDLLKEFYKGVNPNAPPSKVKIKKEMSLSTNL